MAAEFDRCFQEMHVMENIVNFITNPCLPIDMDTVSVKLQDAFSLPNGVDMETIEVQSDTEMQARAKDSNFWGFVSR